jgi:hypothetical protein
MLSIDALLMVLAFVFFLLAAVSVPSGKLNLTALGLACWVATYLVG